MPGYWLWLIGINPDYLKVFHSVADEVGIVLHKGDNVFVVFGVLVVFAVALHHFDGSQVHLNGFNYLTANSFREYEGIGFLVVFTTEHADILHLALIVILVYAFKFLDNYILVSNYQSEEFGFVGDEILCIFLTLGFSLLLTFTPFLLSHLICVTWINW